MKNKISKFKYKFLNRKGALDRPKVYIKGEKANKLIFDSLTQDSPLMIARFGAFELGIAQSILTPFNLKNLSRFLKGDIASIGFNKNLAESFCNNAGFFPNDKKLIHRYAHMLIQDMKECDILGSWLPGEKFFSAHLINSKSVPLKDLEPFNHLFPWTKALSGKKILVIHPFEDTIRHQWNIKDQLFPSPDILPDFELQIIKAVQSIAGNESRFNNWFDALDYMKGEIDTRDFDIALIGCGAYGFHLAAHIKRLGKKAVHMGGVLQIMFGIMGKRWEGKYPFINDKWIHPLQSDIIKDKESVEDGCYW